MVVPFNMLVVAIVNSRPIREPRNRIAEISAYVQPPKKNTSVFG